MTTYNLTSQVVKVNLFLSGELALSDPFFTNQNRIRFKRVELIVFVIPKSITFFYPKSFLYRIVSLINEIYNNFNT